MFEHFTFGAQAQTPRCFSPDFHQPCPTDTSCPLPPSAAESLEPQQDHLPSQPGINDLVKELGKQNLTLESDSPSYFHSLPSPPFEDDDKQYKLGLTPFSPRSAPRSPVLPPVTSGQKESTMCSRRLQRQLNVQLLSCADHVRNINDLVDQMISTNSQCTFRRPMNLSPPPSREHALPSPLLSEHDVLEVDTSADALEEDSLQIDEDEGFVDGEWSIEEEMEMSLRRASAPSGIRKNGIVKWRGAAETVGRGKVWCAPRMRKRSRGVVRS